MTRRMLALQPPEVLAGPAPGPGSDDDGGTRVYTIWPANRLDLPALSSGAWYQERRWFVLDVTEGLAAAHIVEGPVSHPEALRREDELRVVAQTRSSARARGGDI